MCRKWTKYILPRDDLVNSIKKTKTLPIDTYIDNGCYEYTNKEMAVSVEHYGGFSLTGLHCCVKKQEGMRYRGSGETD